MKQFTGFMHGINLGGWFSQCDNTEKRYDNFVKREDFRRIGRWGVDHVRLPFDYNLILDEEMNFKEKGWTRLADAIAWAKENNLNIVLDLHKTVGFSFDVMEKEDGFFTSEKYQDIFYGIWKETAKRFGNLDNVAFELLNEVTEKEYMPTWNKIIKKAIETIRTESKTVKVLVGGYYNNAVEAVKDLDMPYDENVVYNFHCYSPLIFTHQGAYWIGKMPLDFRMKFDSTNNEYIKWTEENIGKKFKDSFPENDELLSETYFEDMFMEAIKVAEERNVALYCGEYGVIDRADPEDTVKWYKMISKVFNKYGIGRACWSYKEMDFGMVDAHYDDVRDEIIKVL